MSIMGKMPKEKNQTEIVPRQATFPTPSGKFIANRGIAESGGSTCVTMRYSHSATDRTSWKTSKPLRHSLSSS